MKRTSLMLLVCCFWILNVSCGSGNLFQPDKKNALRAPSYPLITIDPYTSIWSFTDRLRVPMLKNRRAICVLRLIRW